MKKWWFENSMNRGMMKSCKCWQWWFEEIKEPGQTGETNRICRGLSQIRDPAAGAKGSHLWQPWNIRRTIAGFHCKPHFTKPPIPGYCFSHCRPFPASLPLTDPESTKRAVIHAAVLWNHPLATMFFAAIRPYRAGLQRDPVIAAFSCNLCRRRSPGHPPPPGKAPCLANWLWLHKIATCVRSFNNLWWPKVPLKKLVGHSGLQLHFIDRNHWLMEASGWRARPVIVWLLLRDLLLLLVEETIFRCSM